MRYRHYLPALTVFILMAFQPVQAGAETGMAGEDTWLPSLMTETPQAGFALAVKLSRMGVKTTQPDVDVLKELRPEYAHDADSLMDASRVIAIHFQTIAQANNYWRDSD